MEQAQYAIMRFAKYKGPEISTIEAHNERTKEKYVSNPDVDTSRSKYNFHLIKPSGFRQIYRETIGVIEFEGIRSGESLFPCCSHFLLHVCQD